MEREQRERARHRGSRRRVGRVHRDSPESSVVSVAATQYEVGLTKFLACATDVSREARCTRRLSLYSTKNCACGTVRRHELERQRVRPVRPCPTGLGRSDAIAPIIFEHEVSTLVSVGCTLHHSIFSPRCEPDHCNWPIESEPLIVQGQNRLRARAALARPTVMSAIPESSLASIISNPECIGKWWKFPDCHPLAELHAKFWGKDLAKEEEAWRAEQQHQSTSNPGDDESEDDDEITSGCYVLDISNKGLRIKNIWVRVSAFTTG
jgi:hypothetical protein